MFDIFYILKVEIILTDRSEFLTHFDGDRILFYRYLVINLITTYSYVVIEECIV
jgi:hypothetical protein